MADLFNQQISATYSGLLKTTSSGVLTSSLTQITDGRGNGSPLYISTVAINFYNAYSFPSTDGTADQILSTDGAGAITWVDVSGGDVLKTGTIVANEIAIWNDNDSTLRSDPTLTIDVDHKITLYQPNSVLTDLESYNIGGGNIANTTGIENVGFGKDNLLSNTTGSYNLAIGKDALFSNTTGGTNVAIGRQSMYNNLGGSYNMALGSNALLSNTTGSRNVAIGSQAVEGNTSGSFNIGIGDTALKQNTTASYQIAIGSGSLYLNNGGYNTAIGYEAITNNTSGVQNTAIGYQSMRLSTIGDVNTAIGYGSGGSLTTGSYNVLIGGGNAITTGSSNVVIGRDGGSSIATLSNRIIISDGDGNIRQTFDDSGDATFSGNVGINTSTADIIGYSTPTFGILGVGSDFPSLQIGIPGTSEETSDIMGDINFFSKNATGAVVSRSVIRSGLDGATNSNYFNFFTMNDGTLAERVRITSGGKLQILKDTNTNGTSIEENNMAFTVLSAPNESKIAIGACASGEYGYIQVMQDATDWSNRSLLLQPRGGNVIIGTYTNAGYKLDVNGSARVSNIVSNEGSLSAATNTATTAFAVSGAGLYQVFAYLPAGGGDATNYSASANVLCAGSTARIVASNGGLTFITLSGLNVQVQQDSGNTNTIVWRYLKI